MAGTLSNGAGSAGWQFVMSTSNLSVGNTYAYQINLNDGTERNVPVPPQLTAEPHKKGWQAPSLFCEPKPVFSYEAGQFSSEGCQENSAAFFVGSSYAKLCTRVRLKSGIHSKKTQIKNFNDSPMSV
jgi:hypothetical protein